MIQAQSAHRPVQSTPYSVFTFKLNQVLLGIDVNEVLLLDQNLDRIQPLPVEQNGISGLVKWQGKVVPVLDLAAHLGHPGELTRKQRLITQLHQQQQRLQAIFQPLETTLALSQQPVLSADLRIEWSFPITSHTEIDAISTQLAARYLDFKTWYELIITADPSTCQSELGQGKQIMKAIQLLFHQLQEVIESMIRPVLLFVTVDGQSAEYALVLTEICDVVEYTQLQSNQAQSTSLAAIGSLQQSFKGIFSDGAETCFYLNTHALLASVSALQLAD